MGRTRLQKIAYLLEVVDLGDGFSFDCRHYGPYSEQLAEAVSTAAAFGFIAEEEKPTAWGGTYSVFTSSYTSCENTDPARIELIKIAAHADPIALELAATAVFFARKGERSPWDETARRKPEKAAKLDAAKSLYSQLMQVKTAVRLPDI
jgi:uncharacterized protein YwgA